MEKQLKKHFFHQSEFMLLVEWEGETTTIDPTIDRKSSITVHFHKRRLTEDQDLFVREGDFVYYGSFYYEIVTLNQPKELFGQTDHKVEISAKCVRARKGLFDAR